MFITRSSAIVFGAWQSRGFNQYFFFTTVQPPRRLQRRHAINLSAARDVSGRNLYFPSRQQLLCSICRDGIPETLTHGNAVNMCRKRKPQMQYTFYAYNNRPYDSTNVCCLKHVIFIQHIIPRYKYKQFTYIKTVYYHTDILSSLRQPQNLGWTLEGTIAPRVYDSKYYNMRMWLVCEVMCAISVVKNNMHIICSRYVCVWAPATIGHGLLLLLYLYTLLQLHRPSVFFQLPIYLIEAKTSTRVVRTYMCLYTFLLSINATRLFFI